MFLYFSKISKVEKKSLYNFLIIINVYFANIPVKLSLRQRRYLPLQQFCERRNEIIFLPSFGCSRADTAVRASMLTVIKVYRFSFPYFTPFPTSRRETLSVLRRRRSLLSPDTRPFARARDISGRYPPASILSVYFSLLYGDDTSTLIGFAAGDSVTFARISTCT